MSSGSEALDCFEKDLGIDPEELSSEDMETVREEWEDFVQDSFEPDEPERLPGYDLDLDGTTYRIRGVYHGMSKGEASLDDDSVEALADYINSYMEEGAVFMEERLPELFPVSDDVCGLHDVSTAYKSYPDKMAEAEAIKILVESFPEHFDLSSGNEEVKPTPTNLRDQFINQRANTLPFCVAKDHGYDVRDTVKTVRSRYQIDEVVSRSSNEQEVVTAVVGMGHLHQIADYMQTEYEADLADGYF